MNDFEKTGKQLPYAEKEGYVERLVAKATEKAIGQSHSKVRIRPLHAWLAAAAAVLLLAVVGMKYFVPSEYPEDIAALQAKPTISDETLDDALLLAYNNLSTEDQEFLIEVYEEDYFMNDYNEEEQ